MNDTYIYHIDGNTPTFYVNEFFTDSVCAIESYQLFVMDEEEELTENNMIAEGTVDDGIVEF